MGSKPIADIKAPEVLMCLRRIESRGALESAHRIKIICGQVFRYAVATGRAERDPTADLKGALPPRKPKYMAAITDPEGVAGLLRAIDGYDAEKFANAVRSHWGIENSVHWVLCLPGG